MNFDMLFIESRYLFLENEFISRERNIRKKRLLDKIAIYYI